MLNLKKRLGIKLKKIFWRHKWHYINPFSRRCTVCDRHEKEYCDDIKNIDTRRGHHWWEVHDKGQPEKHYET